MTKYVWFDIETTGLNLKTDKLLEIGAVVCDDKMKSLASFSRHQHYQKENPPTMSPTVLAMHRASGLLDECEKNPQGLLTDDWGFEEIEIWVAFEKWVESWREEGEDIVPCGSGILHFDLPYIRENATWMLAVFTYYAIDVGVLRRMIRLANPKIPSFSAETKKHRALTDAYDHLEEFRKLSDIIRLIAV